MNYNPWEDENCQAEFVEQNASDFDYWLAEKGIDPRFCKQSDYHLSYCEIHENDFLEFASNFEEELKLEKADSDNEALEERDWE